MTDALSFIERQTAHKGRAFLFGLVFLFPALGNFISRLTRHHGWWLNDFDAVVCGAHALARGVSPYNLHPVCNGLRPATFVYAPQIAALFAPPVEGFGFEGARLAWLVLLVPAMGLLIWYALFKAMPKAPFALRLMTLAAINGSAFACGNVAWVLHGAVVAAALLLNRTRLPFICAVILAALVKPVFLTYLIVLLYEERPWRDRIPAVSVAAVTGLAAVAWLILAAGPLGGAWHETLKTIVVSQQPGIGFSGDAAWIGLPPASPLAAAGFGLFAAIIALSGLVIAECGGLEPSERTALGIGVAMMLNPRLMDYDLVVMAPAMAIVVKVSRTLGVRIFTAVTWIFAGVLLLGVIVNLAAFASIKRAPVAVFVYSGLTIFVAARLWIMRRRADVPAPPTALPDRCAPH
ncbi:MAG: hypothetical protein ACXU8U_07080 [Asticcacaulis sp.]